MLGLIFPNTSVMTLEPFSRNGHGFGSYGIIAAWYGCNGDRHCKCYSSSWWTPYLYYHVDMLYVVSILVFQIGTVKVFPKYNTITLSLML